ncbi:MAG: hypothetical protein AB8G96_12930 [Phycisphaerales bacterium]
MESLNTIASIGPAVWIGLLTIVFAMLGGLLVVLTGEFDRGIRWHMLTVQCHRLRRERRLQVIAAEREAQRVEDEIRHRREDRRRHRLGLPPLPRAADGSVDESADAAAGSENASPDVPAPQIASVNVPVSAEPVRVAA